MTKVITDEQQIEKVLSRGVETIYPDKDSLKKVLMSGKRIKLYCGFDPTATSLHIGNALNIRKLAKFQELGHEVIFLVGDFTAMIGDPTDKKAARTQLSRNQVLSNCKSWKKQAQNLIKFSGSNPAKLMYNSKWLGKMKFADVLQLASHFSVQQMMERDMFQKRLADEKPVFIHEFMYPLMQGYDSVALDVDLEIGGNDQTFNMLAGRTLMRVLKDKEKFVLTQKLLTDPTGKKMGKTEGNMINLTDTAEDIFGKVMSWTDQMIKIGFEILTDIPLEEIEKMGEAMNKGANPRDFKLQLAYEVVKIYKDADSAEASRDNFIKVFSQGQKPEEINEYRIKVSAGNFSVAGNLINILVETGLASSKSEARRLIEQKGVKSNDVVIEDVNQVLTKGKHLIQKGKRFFVNVIIE
ncbi:MAG: tyrosine--tRNA ligase [Candidatus Parcubacteria bacterium]|nr:tyrosine--tRNA ligase [Candidatus Parcubacteria bacterium]